MHIIRLLHSKDVKGMLMIILGNESSSFKIFPQAGLAWDFAIEKILCSGASIFEAKHAIVNLTNMCQLHDSPRIFTRVRTRTDRQTNGIRKHFTKNVGMCKKMHLAQLPTIPFYIFNLVNVYFFNTYALTLLKF